MILEPDGAGVPPYAGDELEAIVSLAIELATSAGELLLGYYDGADPSEALALSAQSKTSRTDIVTAADKASEKMIVSRLEQERSRDGILAEEGSAREGDSGLTWVIDPLDGTINFLYGFPAFAVSIGCEHYGRRIAGVVRDPLRDETFVAALGQGASIAGVRSLHIASDPPPLGEALVSTGFSYDASRRLAQARLLETILPSVRDIRRAGAAALDLCWVAAGRLDGCFETGLAPWDLAAGALVVSEAGGVVELVEGIIEGAATIVAGPPRLQAELLALVTQASAHVASRSKGPS